MVPHSQWFLYRLFSGAAWSYPQLLLLAFTLTKLKLQLPHILDTAEKQNCFADILLCVQALFPNTLALLSLNVLCSMGIYQSPFYKTNIPLPGICSSSTHYGLFVLHACLSNSTVNLLLAKAFYCLTSYCLTMCLHMVVLKKFEQIPLSASLVSISDSSPTCLSNIPLRGLLLARIMVKRVGFGIWQFWCHNLVCDL